MKGGYAKDVRYWRKITVTRDNLLSRILIDPNICFGKPCIRGHRIWVSLILDYLAGGMTVEEILEAYPSIEREDVFACIAYAAEVTRDYYAEIPLEKKEAATT
ncbi:MULTISPECIES: DUF433 domain-containing protein [unclassified Microcoleus]|uniref:DUF433 domain-containing protein n=1 Tax=unclassified Microcoleus TaxID=2642155 RepID=UPI002FD6DD05